MSFIHSFEEISQFTYFAICNLSLTFRTFEAAVVTILTDLIGQSIWWTQSFTHTIMIKCFNSTSNSFPFALFLVAKSGINAIQTILATLNASSVVNVSKTRYSLDFTIWYTGCFIQEEAKSGRARCTLGCWPFTGQAFSAVTWWACQPIVDYIANSEEPLRAFTNFSSQVWEKLKTCITWTALLLTGASGAARGATLADAILKEIVGWTFIKS